VIQGSQDCAVLEVRVAALEAQAERYQAALDAISQGVAFFDRERRLILANRRYAEIYRLSPDRLPPGATLREITELRFAVGTCPMAVDDYVAYVTAIAEKREDRDWSVSLSDGRTIRVRFRPSPDGGWVATPGESGEGIHAVMRLARASSSHAAVLRARGGRSLFPFSVAPD